MGEDPLFTYVLERIKGEFGYDRDIYTRNDEEYDFLERGEIVVVSRRTATAFTLRVSEIDYEEEAEGEED